MKNAFNLETLTAMSADELEQYSDRGREYRVMLNCAVLSQLTVPEGWHVVAEEGCEFRGGVPVVCRISPAGDEATAIFLCSSGAEVPYWAAVLPFQETALAGNQGGRVAWLHIAENFEPETINQILKNIGEYYRHGFTKPEQLAVALRMGGLCV
ncbi:recombinase [Serratia liquefaciens]|uniref:conjugation system SOS inhibitor PsiB n=1 Tax=Serratia liquefaciens TaxID=614 RepID=UPI0010223F87|nr:conjugation system SOS inhibitor PsiB [Serratia liquefaciens]RYM64445.1 recombinase [Serratia liquefaciens]